MRKPFILLLLCFPIAGAVGLQLYRDHKPADVGPVSPAPAVSVTVAEVQRRDLALTVAAVGRAEAKASVPVKSRIDGQVAQTSYVEGQPVRKGQPLIRIDPAVLETQQRQANAVLSRDTAQLTKVQGDYQRNLGLVAQGFISQSALGQSKADLETAQSNLKADRAAFDNAGLQLGFTRITAPMDGVAGALLAPVGSSVKANDTTLLVINQVQPIYVTFTLPESQLADIKRAQRRGGVAVEARVAGVQASVRGELAFIDNAVDSTTGAITAKAVFANTDRALTPGQFAQVALELDALHDVLVVPATAVESGIDGPYVFIVNADSTVTLQPVKLGPQSDGYQVVASGLAKGQRVVMTGQARLRDKSRVAVGAAATRTP
jgi:multidrug efflux system membrane fusion protein